jgi:hypothetical protein
VRLDHLLSREHHPPGWGGMEPAARACRVGVLVGGDTGGVGFGGCRSPEYGRWSPGGGRWWGKGGPVGGGFGEGAPCWGSERTTGGRVIRSGWRFQGQACPGPAYRICPLLGVGGWCGVGGWGLVVG